MIPFKKAKNQVSSDKYLKVADVNHILHFSRPHCITLISLCLVEVFSCRKSYYVGVLSMKVFCSETRFATLFVAWSLFSCVHLFFTFLPDYVALVSCGNNGAVKLHLSFCSVNQFVHLFLLKSSKTSRELP